MTMIIFYHVKTMTRTVNCKGSVVSLIFYLRFDIESSEGHTFTGNAGGISTPGGGAEYGTLTILDENIYKNTTSFQFTNPPGYLSILFFDSDSTLLGHADLGSISTVVGTGGGSGSWS